MKKKIELVPLRQRKNSLNSRPKKGTKIGKSGANFRSTVYTPSKASHMTNLNQSGTLLRLSKMADCLKLMSDPSTSVRFGLNSS